MTPAELVGVIADINLENAFNPYADRCDVFDKPHAPMLRRKLLSDILNNAITREIDALWIGRDLGHRGGRRTGMALTDDVHMIAHASRWGLEVSRPTIGQPVAERTASMVWDILSAVPAPIFLWNVFPLHPHEPGRPFTNRAHSSHERGVGEDILALLIETLRPRRLIAIGNDAAVSAIRIAAEGQQVVHVRHPSYGGHKEFLAGMTDIYKPIYGDRLF
jgi:hypothetical protein